MKFKANNIILTLAIASCFQSARAEDRIQLARHDVDVYADDVVVTANHMAEPLVIETDPRIPRQPLPAHDGADYLKTIPGFSVMRKGGSDGEPIFRGMAGSRLNILVDGQNVQGGCSMRMDAPTSYIFPEAYDKLTIVKGPQTVLFGPGGSAASVMFDRSIKFLKEPGYTGRSSLLVGSFGRNDEVVDIKAGNESFYVQGVGTNSFSQNYKDGNGDQVHSGYHRYSGNVGFGFAFDENTKLELSGAYSNGWAQYADRAMDGAKFQRENYALRFEKTNISPLINKISLLVSRNDIDHVMDDYSLRQPPSMSSMQMGWAQLKHQTDNFKFRIDLSPKENFILNLGMDAQLASHEKAWGRNYMKSIMTDPSLFSRDMQKDSTFKQIGFFGEGKYFLNDDVKFVGGYRFDEWDAKDKRDTTNHGTEGSDTSGRKRSEGLNSGFIRVEKNIATYPITFYTGFGHSERFPDYWELIPSHRGLAGMDGNSSAFLSTKVEKTNQLDLGFVSTRDKLSYSGSVFYSDINDYILIDYRSAYKGMMNMGGSSRNIDAYSYGAEFDAAYKINDEWKTTAAFAYVRGRNETDNKALSQLPPLEARVGLSYDDHTWFGGALVRAAAEQNHYSAGQGNIAGQDIGRSGGFATVSLHAGYRPTKQTVVTAGVDNLFDKNYAEFISRSGSNGMGSPITGFVQTTRVNEPGRTIWLKGTINF